MTASKGVVSSIIVEHPIESYIVGKENVGYMVAQPSANCTANNCNPSSVPWTSFDIFHLKTKLIKNSG